MQKAYPWEVWFPNTLQLETFLSNRLVVKKDPVAEAKMKQKMFFSHTSGRLGASVQGF